MNIKNKPVPFWVTALLVILSGCGPESVPTCEPARVTIQLLE